MSDNEQNYRTALHLEYFTILYNFFEAIASIIFGSASGNISLVGFGLDSIIESFSGTILIWRLKKHTRNLEPEDEKIHEQTALKLIAISFVILGIYVLYESIYKLVTHEISNPSLPGIIIAILSIIIMPLLAWKKRDIAGKIHSKALFADAEETIFCALLSVALLCGLVSNYMFGFWQADPLVGIIITIFLFWEGIELWKESHEQEEV